MHVLVLNRFIELGCPHTPYESLGNKASPHKKVSLRIKFSEKFDKT